MLSFLGTISIPIVVIGIFVGIIASGYVKAPPDKAFIISGLRKKPRVLIGKAGIKLPFFERKDTLLIKQISVDIKTNGYIPTLDFIGVDVDAIAKIQVDTSVGDEGSGINLAMRNFLNMGEGEIVQSLTESLQGNMREIIGTMTLKDISNDRKKFGDEVQLKAQADMKALGIKIISCNIQSVKDEQDLISSLGQENLSQIQKDASIAKANADRDVAVAQAAAEQDANDARVTSQLAIAEKNNELAIQQAELKKIADARKAEADAVYQIQQEEQRKTLEITAANANLARQDKEIELQERAVTIKERTLEATVKKEADAQRYAREQEADANKYTRQQAADAERYEQQQNSDAELYQTQQEADADLHRRKRKAEAEQYEAERQAEATKAASEAQLIAAENEAAGIRAKCEAEAAGIQLKGEAEAAAIKAKALAEAEGTMQKAEAMKQYGDAAQMDMQLKALTTYFEQLPLIAQAIATPLANIDSITMYGDGNTAKLTGDITTTVKQVTNGIKDATGIDPMAFLAGMLGGKIGSADEL